MIAGADWKAEIFISYETDKKSPFYEKMEIF